MAEVTDAVHSRDTDSPSSSSGSTGSSGSGSSSSSSGGRVDMTKKPEEDDRPPFDADAT
jgi:sec-independent protein translocase protein TatB